jgi:hypothetical protein
MLAQSNFSTASALLRFSRWNRFRSIALLFVVGAICSSTSVSQPVQLRDARIDPPNMLALPGHHPQWADVANDEGPLPSTQRLPPLTLVLSRSAKNEANFEKLLRDQQLPASPDYHRWLTSAEVGERFGGPAQDLTSVRTWLEANNLHVDWVSPSRVFIGFSGNAGEVGRAFQTEIHTYNVNGIRRFAVSVDPSVPAELAPIIQAVRGLYQVSERPLHRFRSLNSAVPEFTDASEHFLTPQDFATIYDITQTAQVSGQSIGIVGVSRTDAADFTNFNNLTGANVVPPTEIVPTAFGGLDPGPAYTTPPAAGVSLDAQAEATLDVLRAGSTAQGANSLLVVASGSSGGIGADAQYLVQTSPVPAYVMSISFGVCESSVGDSEVKYWDTLFQQAAAEGISVFVASGDAGASGCDANFSTPPAKPQPNSPNAICSSSYATCVGGTEFNDTADPSLYWNAANGSNLNSAVSYIPEGGWNEPLNQNSQIQVASSGGGVSKFIATPSWQTGMGVPASRSGRYTPDVAFSAADHDGYFGCFAAAQGSCVESSGQFAFSAFSGTSAAAPSMAGIALLLNAERGVAQGNLNSELYNLSSSAPAVFHDVTVSTSGVANCSVKTPSMCNNSIAGPTALTNGQSGYLVTAGYDEVTGLGSLDVQQFLTSFAGSRAAPTLTIAASASITTAQPDDVSVTVVGTGSNPPTGSVALTCGSYTSAAITLSNGQASFIVPAGSFPVGSDTLAATYTPDAASAVNYNPASASIPVTVSSVGIITPSILVAPSAAQTTTAQSLLVITSVNGGSGNATPTGSITLSSGTYQSAPGSLTGSQSQITVPAQALPPGQDMLTATYTPDATSSSIYASATGAASVNVTVASKVTPSISGQAPTTSITTAQAFSVTVGVSVALGPAYQTPTGSVTASSGSYSSAATSLSNGTATINVPAGALAVGTDTMNLNYTPDAGSSAVYTTASGTVSVTIVSPPQPSFALSGTSTTLSPGASTGNSSTITITPNNGFTGTIELTAALTSSPTGAQDLPTLSFGATNPVIITGTGAGTAVLTINTTAPMSAALTVPARPASRLFSLGGGVLACMFFVCIGSRRRRWVGILGMSLLWTLAAGGILACGSEASSGGGIANPGTTAGSYIVTITGTSGSETSVGTITITVR